MKMSQTGFTILYAVLTASVVLVIALSITDRIVRDLSLSSSTRESQRAVFAADAALECSLFWDIKHEGYDRSVFGSYGNQITQGDLESGLQAHWLFNEGPDAVAALDSEGSNHAAIVNGDTSSMWVAGQTGWGIDLDGADDRLAIADIFYDTAGEIDSVSACAWINTTDEGPSAIIDFDRSDYWSLGVDFLNVAGDEGKISWTTVGEVTGANDMESTIRIDDGEWHHVCGVYDSGATVDKALYIDGQVDSTLDFHALNEGLGSGVVTRYGFIGTGSEAGSYNNGTNANKEYDGIIDEARIYNRALSAAEVEGLYKLGTLIGYWPLNEAEGITANDSSLANNDGILENFTEPYPWTLGKFGNALEIDADGVTERVKVENEAFYDLNTYSYSFWVKPLEGANGVYRNVIVKGDTSLTGRAPGIWLHPSTMQLHVTHQVYDSAGDVDTQTAMNTYALLDVDEWTHVVVTSSGDGGQLRVYIDGALDNTADHVFDLTTNDHNLFFGRGGQDGNLVLDDIRLYSRVLTDDEIEDLAGDLPPFNDPVSQGVSDPAIECAGAVITDSSEGWDPVNGWDITVAPNDRGATTTYDVAFPNGTCATVTMGKLDGRTTVDSRGYNTCDLTSPRRVERGLRATY